MDHLGPNVSSLVIYKHWNDSSIALAAGSTTNSTNSDRYSGYLWNRYLWKRKNQGIRLVITHNPHPWEMENQVKMSIDRNTVVDRRRDWGKKEKDNI